MVDSSLLQILDLKISYGSIEAVKGISLDVKEGEIVSLLGGNGAGKSTLLKGVMRVLPIRSGGITYQGRNLLACRSHELVKLGLSLVPEGRGILSTLTVLENLELGAFHRKKWKNDCDRVLELFPLIKERLHQRAGNLSGGEQQMLALARAMVSAPKMLLLDEPSLGLAPRIIQDIFQVIQEIQKQGVSILLIEQNAHMALKIADRVFVMETGQIVLEGSPQEVRNNEDLKKAYLGG